MEASCHSSVSGNRCFTEGGPPWWYPRALTPLTDSRSSSVNHEDNCQHLLKSVSFFSLMVSQLFRWFLGYSTRGRLHVTLPGPFWRSTPSKSLVPFDQHFCIFIYTLKKNLIHLHRRPGETLHGSVSVMETTWKQLKHPSPGDETNKCHCMYKMG